MPGQTASTLFTPRKFYSSNHAGKTSGVASDASDWDVPLEFDCSNIPQINITQELGRGVYKTGLLGVYHGRHVVIKMVTNSSYVYMKCVEERPDMPIWEKRCHFFVTMYIMKEILLLQQLRNPNFLGLLGFCARGDDIRSMSLKEHGVIAVYEYGDEVNVSDMKLWPFRRRLDTAIQLLDLAVYAEHSPLGSLRLGDMKHGNFLFVGSRIKFSDADLVTAEGHRCSSRDPDSRCVFDLPCVKNSCQGYNAKVNLMLIHQLFLTWLLDSSGLDEGINTSSSVIKSANKKLFSVQSELNVLNTTASSNGKDIYWKLVSIRRMLEN